MNSAPSRAVNTAADASLKAILAEVDAHVARSNTELHNTIATINRIRLERLAAIPEPGGLLRSIIDQEAKQALAAVRAHRGGVQQSIQQARAAVEQQSQDRHERFRPAAGSSRIKKIPQVAIETPARPRSTLDAELKARDGRSQSPKGPSKGQSGQQKSGSYKFGERKDYTNKPMDKISDEDLEQFGDGNRSPSKRFSFQGVKNFFMKKGSDTDSNTNDRASANRQSTGESKKKRPLSGSSTASKKPQAKRQLNILRFGKSSKPGGSSGKSDPKNERQEDEEGKNKAEPKPEVHYGDAWVDHDDPDLTTEENENLRRRLQSNAGASGSYSNFEK